MDSQADHPAPVIGLCAICQSPIHEVEPAVACPGCSAPYHTECWTENGGCGVYGCSLVPQVELRSGMEIPASFWGRDEKPCPSCGREILAAAVRCRYCGATFASALPEDAGTFRERKQRDQLVPGLARQALWLFVFCVIPCTAPIATIAAVVWWVNHRRELKFLPPLHAGLARLALIVGGGQIAIAMIMGILFGLFRSS